MGILHSTLLSEGMERKQRTSHVLVLSKLCPHTRLRIVQGRHPRSVGETKKQSSSHVPAHLLPCLHKHAFSSFWSCSFEFMRKKSVKQEAKIGLEEGKRKGGMEGNPAATNTINTINCILTTSASSSSSSFFPVCTCQFPPCRILKMIARTW